jgi:predicted nucleic acid-binding protein
VNDLNSAEARQRVKSASRLWFTPHHRAEWAHAIAQHIFRHQATPAEADAAYDALYQDTRAGSFIVVPLPENAFDLCADLARRYGPKIGMRTLDSLHVACALELNAERFWTFDDRQRRLASAAGLKTS